MKNRQNQGNFDMEQAMKLLGAMMSPRGFAAYFGGIEPPEEKYPYERLGDGYELRPIEILAEGGQLVLDNEIKYSHLYHNGLKVSDEVFRVGGMGGKFKDNYCSLIHYTQEREHTEEKLGFSFGTFVIINHLGDIVLKGESFSSDHPHHIGGHIASKGNYIYDLRTGKAIAPKSSSSMKGSNFLFIEHKYSWYNKEVELPLGIYAINLFTAEISKIDDIK